MEEHKKPLRHGCQDMGNLDSQCISFLKRQLALLYDISEIEEKLLRKYSPIALAEACACVAGYKRKIIPSILHASFMCICTHNMRKYLCNTDLFDALYVVCRSVFSVDMYGASLPPHVFFEHPLGTVIGRAALGDFLTVFQGVTIGGSIDAAEERQYPTIGKNVILYAHSAVIGQCVVGNNVVLGSGARVINSDIPDNSLVFGVSPNLVIKRLYQERYNQLSPFTA